MRTLIPLLVLVTLASCCSARQAGRLSGRAPIWYRDGGARGMWTWRRIDNPIKEEMLYYLEISGDKRLLIRLIDDEDRAVCNRAAMVGHRRKEPAVIRALERAWRRFPDDSQIAYIFAQSAVNHWSGSKIRELFWSLSEKEPKKHGDQQVRWFFRTEMARCGTEEDAVRLIAQLPAGANWQRDPVIGRIRLHRSKSPDKLAFEILESWLSADATTDSSWSKYLYRQELIRYLTFGRDARYRKYFVPPAFYRFARDVETHPSGLETLIEKWEQRN